MKISVITPTIRKEGLKLVWQALSNQDFEDWEWLICSKFDPCIPIATWVKDDFEGGFWSLNRAYNKLFKEAKGELIVSWQDNIWVKPDGLQKFWDAYQETKGIISGVGDQYDQLDEYGKPTHKIWADPRKHNKFGTFYESVYSDAEWNWCAIPKQAILDIGGMDEELDLLGYGGDQLQICERLNEAGAHFYLDQSNESFTLRHDRSDFGGDKNWNENHVVLNGVYDIRLKHLKQTKQWPRLAYLAAK